MDVSPAFLAQLYVERSCYVYDRRISQGQFGVKVMTTAQASFIQQDLMLGKEQWVRTKKNFASFVALPSWPDLRSLQTNFTPPFVATIAPGKINVTI